jgi:NTE family protein
MSDPTDTLAALPRPLAFVLSGGAGLGALQVGQLRALAELGIVPDIVVGTSVGAINGFFVAKGFSVARVAELETIWLGLRTRDVFANAGLMGLLRLARGGGALASSAGVSALIARHLPARYADLVHSAHAVATDNLTGQDVLLSEGDLRRNVLASTAIPGIFPPVEVAGRQLVDGAISANVPIGQAARLGARAMIVLDAGFPCALAAAPRGGIRGMVHTIALALRNQTTGALSALSVGHTIVYLPVPCPLNSAPYDFSNAAVLIPPSYSVARDFLQQLAFDGPGVYGRPHLHEEAA